MTATPTPWTAEKDYHLTELWQSGLSSAQIGLRLNISKNSVIGRAHRLRLPTRPSPVRPVGSGKRPHGTPPKERRHTLGPIVAEPPPQPLSPVRRCQFPLWPHGARSNQHFCGAPARLGRSYCPEHCRRCFSTDGWQVSDEACDGAAALGEADRERVAL